jgi:hypothetical protein
MGILVGSRITTAPVTNLFSLGSDGPYDNGWNTNALNTDNEICVPMDVGTGGLQRFAYRIEVRAGGDTAPCDFRACIWDAAGGLLMSTGIINVAAGVHAAGNQPITGFDFADFAISGALQVGWWRDPARDQVWSQSLAGPNFLRSTCLNGSSACNHSLTGCAPYICGRPGVVLRYRTYTPGTDVSQGGDIRNTLPMARRVLWGYAGAAAAASSRSPSTPWSWPA